MIGDRKKARIDYIETVAEEIELMTGIKCKVVNETIHADTFIGEVKFDVAFYVLMEDVYRFIYVYGGKMNAYGIKHRIEYRQ
jgi:hypothetical protein